MGLSDKALENKRKYIHDYKKNHYKRIPLDVSSELYSEIKTASERNGTGVNTFIKSAIIEKLSRDSDNK